MRVLVKKEDLFGAIDLGVNNTDKTLVKQNCMVCFPPCNFAFIQIVLGTVPEGGWFNVQAS